jgi:hypothetical protein
MLGSLKPKPAGQLPLLLWPALTLHPPPALRAPCAAQRREWEETDRRQWERREATHAQVESR